MKNIILAGMLALTGCAHYSTTQTDVSYEKGQPLRAITTKVSVGTLFDSTSKLASSKAAQTDKSQSSTLGGLEQSASSTNTVAALQAASSMVHDIMSKAP